MSRIDDIEEELNAVRYWLRLLFVMHGITSKQVLRHINGLKNQDPEQFPELPLGEFERLQAEQMPAIETLGLDIAEYLQRFERAAARKLSSQAKPRSQKPKHPPKR